MGSERATESIVDFIQIAAGKDSYPTIVGSELLSNIGSLLRNHSRLHQRDAAIISDANVASIFADAVVSNLKSSGFNTTLITVPPGENSKSLQQAGAICEEMASAGLDRSSFIIARGGGVVGDLAGFVAAIYHRGIPYVQVPTTLLAQVDSSIGGKTAVNSAAGKNLIGALHHPILVITDVDLLRSLPEREFNQGLAEIVKHAIIHDASLLETLENFDRERDFVSLVRRNVEIKAEFVAVDERDETGKRALLNFGHTIGHAIERAGEYREVLHGEAISLGIVAACDISVRKAGLGEEQRTRIVELLKRLGLPTRLPPEISREKILQAVAFDKKFERGQVRFVLTSQIGSARLTSDVTMEDIWEAVLRL